MGGPDRVVLRLLRFDQKVDVVLPNKMFDDIQVLAERLGQDPGVYLREVIKDHVGIEIYKLAPQPRYEWMDR